MNIIKVFTSNLCTSIENQVTAYSHKFHLTPISVAFDSASNELYVVFEDNKPYMG